MAAGESVVTQEDYRQNAVNCLQLADEAIDPAIRMGLIDMAHAWLSLAEEAERVWSKEGSEPATLDVPFSGGMGSEDERTPEQSK